MRLLPVSGTAARLYNACCTPSSYRKGKTLCGKDLKGSETPEVPLLSGESGHGTVWQAKEKFQVFSKIRSKEFFGTRCACVFTA